MGAADHCLVVGGCIMTKPQSPLTAIERPRCTHCQSRMPLISTEVASAGAHLRTFHCVKCNLKLTIEIDADPMKSPLTGWLSGELKGPT